jgi:hypothetical protein
MSKSLHDELVDEATRGIKNVQRRRTIIRLREELAITKDEVQRGERHPLEAQAIEDQLVQLINRRDSHT